MSAVQTDLIRGEALMPRAQLRTRKGKAGAFGVFCLLLTILAIGVLGLLLTHVGMQAFGMLQVLAAKDVPWGEWGFLSNPPSRHPSQAGLMPALWGTLWMVGLTAAMTVPIGVMAAIYLEEYARDTKLNRFISVNIANLAGVPSIVYGMLGLTLFVRWLSLERSVMSGALTMTLLILPVVILAAREALKAVPASIRHAAFAVGATRWQVVSNHVLPAGIPGIATGVILALSRAIGETAPLIMIGALTYIAFKPDGPMDNFTAIPIQVFNWAGRPQPEWQSVAAAGIVVLLVILLLMNSIAIYIRHRAERSVKW